MSPMRRALLLALGLALIFGGVAASATGPAPSFAAARSYRTGASPRAVAIADLNGDRRPDLVTANGSADTVSVLLNRGSGRFRPRREYLVARDAWALAVGDLNGDRHPDVAVATPGGGSVSVLLNRGDGTFAPKHDVQIGHSAWSIALGDLNGDGRQDL